jgi:outer membrane protein
MLARLPVPFVALGALLLATPAVARAELKVGYFDVKRILTEVDEAKLAKTRLQREFEDKQKQLDVEKTDLEKFQKDFEQKQPVLSPAAKEAMQMELVGRMQRAQKLYMELQQELAAKEQQALADLLQRLEPVVREIAESEGYTFVFEKNEAGLFYGPTAHDLTSQVIRRYNQRFPSAQPSATPAKAPAKGGGKK